jgi:manganese/zinc/iron transport system permease protein
VTTAQLEIQVIAVTVALACALPGVFLVLRRLALISDAISHSILLGIVLAFFVVEDLSSPLLIAGAAATGLLTVALVELLKRTELVREDAAIGLVFPTLFSAGVVLIARFADDVHLDVDAVILGELAFAPFDRLIVSDYDLGPKSLWVIGTILVLNVLFISVFYKELKLATFDPALALALGLSPAFVHYGLMALVSVTAVGAFDAVGSILVVALMIAPPATAYLLTDRLPAMLLLSAVVGVVSAIGGYWLAHAFDVSIAGSMTAVAGAAFGLTVLFAPHRGLVSAARRRARQRWEFAQAALAVHLSQHELRPDAAEESRLEHLNRHLRWDPEFARQVVRRAERRGLVLQHDGSLVLTEKGRTTARAATAAS